MELKRFNQFVNENQNLDKPNQLFVVFDDPKRKAMVLGDHETKKRYFFSYEHIDEKDFKYYGDIDSEIVGRDEDGDLEYYYDYDSYETTSDDRLEYVKDHLKKMSIGKGISDWEDGYGLVEIDTMLGHEILSIYDDFTPKHLGLT